jgi:hypothetical protein
VDRALPAGTPVTREYLEQAAGKERRTVLVLWTGAEAMPALEAAAGKNGGVSTIYLSASLLKDGLLTVPETLRERTYITYPYNLAEPRPGMTYPPPPRLRDPLQITDRRVPGKAATLYPVLNELFPSLESYYFRDYMFDIIDASMINWRMPAVLPTYERISFGPGQRYASKGCYIVQLSKGDRPELVRKTDWVVH